MFHLKFLTNKRSISDSRRSCSDRVNWRFFFVFKFISQRCEQIRSTGQSTLQLRCLNFPIGRSQGAWQMDLDGYHFGSLIQWKINCDIPITDILKFRILKLSWFKLLCWLRLCPHKRIPLTSRYSALHSDVLPVPSFCAVRTGWARSSTRKSTRSYCRKLKKNAIQKFKINSPDKSDCSLGQFCRRILWLIDRLVDALWSV